MSDFMDTALNWQPGIRIAPGSKWVMTNGTIQMDVCTVCAQPYREGHIDCTCPSNHASRCERPTYEQLKAQHDEVVAALEAQTRWLHLASQNSGTDPHIRERHQQEAAIGEAALEQVK